MRENVDFLKVGQNAIYTSRLTSQMGKSHFSKIMQMQIPKNFTIRNWNTTKNTFRIDKKVITKKLNLK